MYDIIEIRSTLKRTSFDEAAEASFIGNGLYPEVLPDAMCGSRLSFFGTHAGEGTDNKAPPVDRKKAEIFPQILMFRKAAKHRGEMVELEIIDNGGAIHGVERILDVLGQRLK